MPSRGRERAWQPRATRWLFTRLVGCFPRDFRHAVGTDLLELLEDEARDAARHGGRLGLALYTVRAASTLLRDAALERRTARPAAIEPIRRGGDSMTTSLIDDLRQALRTLRRQPRFLALVTLTLALGIGASVTMFSVFDAVLLRPLPYPDAERLLKIESRFGERMSIDSLPMPALEDLAAQTPTFEAVGAATGTAPVLHGNGAPERLRGAAVSAGFLPLLGVTPELGRLFDSADDRPGAARVALLGHRAFMRRWGGDPAMVGATLVLSGEPHTVIGVLPRRFVAPEALLSSASIEVWVPLASSDHASDDGSKFYLQVIARRAAQADALAAEAAAEAAAARFRARFGGDDVDWAVDQVGFTVHDLHAETVGDVGPTMALLAGAVAFLLLIACVNVANLFLARATDRRREMAMRAALGAGRGRLMRHLIAEGLVVATISGALGVALAALGVRLYRTLGAARLPRLAEATIDARVLGFAASVALFTGLLFALAPAMAGLGARFTAIGAPRLTRGHRSSRLRAALVAVELALALLLAVGAGLMINSLVRIHQVDPGFDPERVLAMSLELDGRYGEDEARRSFYGRLVETLEAIPGVRAAGLAAAVPTLRGTAWSQTAIDGAAADSERPFVRVTPVSDGFFAALDIAVLAGRLAGSGGHADDRATGAPVAVVNRAFAREHLGGETAALGRRLQAVEDDDWRTVVGVVETVRQRGLNRAGEAEVYLPFAQQPQAEMKVVVRSDLDRESTVDAMRHAVWALDPTLPIDGLRPLAQDVAGSIGAPRFLTVVLVGFSLMALALAAVGVFGAMSYQVAQRMRELGIRIALGAASRQVLLLVLRQGLAITAVGLAVGLAAAAYLVRYLERFVYEVRPLDIVTFAGVSLLLLAVALLACLLPARRASRVDPVNVLRCE